MEKYTHLEWFFFKRFGIFKANLAVGLCEKLNGERAHSLQSVYLMTPWHILTPGLKPVFQFLKDETALRL